MTFFDTLQCRRIISRLAILKLSFFPTMSRLSILLAPAPSSTHPHSFRALGLLLLIYVTHVMLCKSIIQSASAKITLESGSYVQVIITHAW